MILSESILDFFPTDKPARNELKGVLFILTTKGKAKVEIDGRSYILKAGVLLTILPSHLLYAIECDKSSEFKILAFSFDEMADFPYMLESTISEKMERTPYILLNNEEINKLEQWYNVIYRHSQSISHRSYNEIIHSLIFIFTAEVSAIYCDKPTRAFANHYEELTDRFFSLLHSNCKTNRKAAFYANKLCVSSKYLTRVILKVTGHTTTYWIADFVIKEAKTLLKSSSLTITQISEMLNFPNSSFFARYFKRYTNLSPQDFRNV